MTRDVFKKEMEEFENECSRMVPPGPLTMFFPIVYIVLIIRYWLKKSKLSKRYKAVSAMLKSMESELDWSEYIGWKKRIDSAYKN